MSKKFIRIIQDIEEGLSREVRRIVFFDSRHRGNEGVSFKEMFDPFTGELKRKPIEPRFYDDSADSLISTSPRFTLRLLKLYEDKETSRLLPPYGQELVECLPSPGAYAVRFGGDDAATTDGGPDSTIELSHRKVREVQSGDYIRLLSGANQGTYIVDTVTLVGNGPHTITLSNDLVIDLPQLTYNKAAGIISFDNFIDLTAVKPGDIFEDLAANSFVISAVNTENSTIVIPSGSALVTGIGSKITRVGSVLQNDDSGVKQCYHILDPNQPISNKATKYRSRSHLIPYTFIYYIKITSRERDDHIAVAERMMQVFNPPRGVLCVLARSQISHQSELKQDALEGATTVFLKDSSSFYAGDAIRICDGQNIGEEYTVKSINIASNSITLETPLSRAVTVDDCSLAISNYDFCTFERDFMNHVTEDRESEQLWIHRFTYKVEAWVESRIDPCEAGMDETTFEDTGDVAFINTALEDSEGDELCNFTVP